MRKIIVVLMIAMGILLVAQVASASPPESWQRDLDFKPHPFADWSWDEIQAYPGFVWLKDRDLYPEGSREWRVATWYFMDGPSSATVSAESGAPPAFEWVGFIVLRGDMIGVDKGSRVSIDSFVAFDSSGAGVTMIRDTSKAFEDYYVPIWFRGTIEHLFDVGIFEGYP